MFSALHSFRDRLSNWTAKKAASKHGLLWLAVISFTESSFFPVPPDFLLAPIVHARCDGKWMRYAALTTITSILGALFGYLIGSVFYNLIGAKIIAWYQLGDAFAYVGTIFQAHAFFAMFAVNFTPIPYKVFTIAAGVFSLNVWVFVLASTLGRGIRFFAVAYIMHRWGDRISGVIYRYFNILTIVFVLLILAFVIFHH